MEEMKKTTTGGAVGGMLSVSPLLSLKPSLSLSCSLSFITLFLTLVCLACTNTCHDQAASV